MASMLEGNNVKKETTCTHHTRYLEHTTSYDTYKHNDPTAPARTCANHSFVRKIMFQFLNFFYKLILEIIFLFFDETLYALKPIQSDL